MKLDSAAAAEKVMRKGIEILHRSLQPGHWEIYRAESILGDCLTQLGEYEEAEQLLLRSYEGLVATLGSGHRMTVDARERLARLNSLAGKPDRSVQIR
jgi:hypothetical protein